MLLHWNNLLHGLLLPGGHVSWPILAVLAVLLVATIALIAYVVFWIYHHGQCYRREAGIVWQEGPAHFMKRTCPAPPYATLADTAGSQSPRICLTSLTDTQSPSWWQRLVRCRDFDALPALTFPTFRRYADRHGYRFVDASGWMDPSRPPAWSKILAVQRLLNDQCDWVFWLDADTMIMNSSIALETILPADPIIDLVAVYDRKFTVNSGSWLLRQSEWSRAFLQTWWDQTAWVRRSGFSLSGDNAAFGHLVDGALADAAQAAHVARPARCLFNSFGVFVEEQPMAPEQEEWYQSVDFYHQGDFIVHASGLDQKAAVLALMAERAT